LPSYDSSGVEQSSEPALLPVADIASSLSISLRLLKRLLRQENPGTSGLNPNENPKNSIDHGNQQNLTALKPKK
jgi:hypothetical protein